MGAAAAAFLAACSKKISTGNDAGGGGSSVPDELESELSIYNWADYVNPETYKAFTADTGVKIKKDFFVSNEELQAMNEELRSMMDWIDQEF